MPDPELDRIRDLIEEENELRTQQDPPDPKRLREIEAMLDQCWDLLRQRRARHEFGEDEKLAQPRDPSVVEGYLQ